MQEGHEADARSDLFALGAIVYEMFAGRRAFAPSRRARLMPALFNDGLRPIVNGRPLTPLAVHWAVAKCLSPDPDERWQSAQDLKRYLQRVTLAVRGTSEGG